ncbi:MAG TPA: hypothetical protein VK474_02460 [Chthoniobacterales bacterium]|nr:hypothetical protein [Chthoniobacterales bacterium]
MNDIAGIPYVAARFDKEGKALNQVTLPPETTDVIVAAHGWNNDQAGAEKLYQDLFTNFKLVAPDLLQKKKVAIVGVIWPSKQFTDVVAAATAEQAGAAAGLKANSAAADATIEAKLDLISTMFGPEAAPKIAQAKGLIAKLEDDPAARDEFVDAMRSLLDPSAAHAEDNSKLFLKMNGAEMLEKLKVPTPLVTAGSGGGGGGASLPSHRANTPEGGAAGLGDLFSGVKSGAMRFLNYFTYYEMKQRAGTVGQKGVGPMIDSLADKVEHIHLVGHSFGGRVVTAAAANSTTEKLQSMSLLQTAFSHNGFSRSMHGFFRDVVDKHRVHGPVLVTYTPNDKAVGIAYPTASRLSGTVASAFGDKDDKYGGLGRNGAQKMEAGEVVSGVDHMRDVGVDYAWQPGKFHNLESSKYIVDPKGGDAHCFVTGKEVAWAISRAMM